MPRLQKGLTLVGGWVGQHPDRPPPRWNITFVLDRRSMFSVTSILPDKRTREHEACAQRPDLVL